MAGPIPPAAPAADVGFPRERRFIFVQLLFSLTAAEIARQSAELVLQDRSFCSALPAYAHLVLATAVVATSWVGWSVSEASLRLKVTAVFEWPFVILLTDVALVILYFILVRGAEIPKRPDDLIAPSAFNETIMIAAILALYFIWDILTKAVMSDGQPGTPNSFFGRFFSRTLWSRGWVSLVCMWLGFLATWFLSSITTFAGVLLADAALLFLVLLFRAMKQKSIQLSVILGLLAIAVGATAYFVEEHARSVAPADAGVFRPAA